MGAACYLLDGERLMLLTGKNEVSVFAEKRDAALAALLEARLPMTTFDAKETYKLGFKRGTPVGGTIEDLLLAAYLLSSSDKSYSLPEMCEVYLPGRKFDAGRQEALLPLMPELREAAPGHYVSCLRVEEMMGEGAK